MLGDYSFLRANTEDFVFSSVIMQSIPASIRKKFTVKEGMTAEDLGKLCHEIYSKITVKHFQKFRKLALNSVDEYGGNKEKLRQEVEDGYGFNRDGCALYFFHLFVVSGLYKAGMKVSYPNGEAENEGFYAIAMWKAFEKMADRLFPEGIHGKTLQGVMLNELVRIGRRAERTEQDEDTLVHLGENVQLAFFRSDRFKGVAMTTPMQKVLSMYHEELCKVLPNDLTELGKVTLDELGKYTKIRITLDKYMELTKVKDKKEARKAIKEACDRLFDIAFIVTVKQGKEKKTYKGRLFQSQMIAYRGGIYEMEFSNDFLRYCATTTPAAFHHGMYAINGNNYRYAWSIGEKLRQHYEINRGKPNANRLSVRKLLEAVPDIPTYEEIMQTNRRVGERIITPVERDLDELQRLGVVKSWEYSNTKGIPLTKEQIDNMDYGTWSQLYITFDLNLPPQDHYIEQHKRRIAAAKKRAVVRKEKPSVKN